MLRAGVLAFIKRGCYKQLPGLILPLVVCLNDTLYGFPVKVCKCHESLCNGEFIGYEESTRSTPPPLPHKIGYFFRVQFSTLEPARQCATSSVVSRLTVAVASLTTVWMFCR